MTAIGPEPVIADRVIDFCPPGADCHAALVRLPARPDQEWLIFAVPAPTAMLDDDRRTARNIALEVAAEARATAERVTHEAILERRRG